MKDYRGREIPRWRIRVAVAILGLTALGMSAAAVFGHSGEDTSRKGHASDEWCVAEAKREEASPLRQAANGKLWEQACFP